MATLYEYYHTSVGATRVGWYFDHTTWRAQTFTPQVEHSITMVNLSLYDVTGPVKVEIRECDGAGRPTGLVLTTGNRNGYGFFPLSPVKLLKDVEYAIVFYMQNPGDSGRVYAATLPSYGRGKVWYSSDSGVTWALQPDIQPTGTWPYHHPGDCGFEEYGVIVGPPTVATKPAIDVTQLSATLCGQLVDDGMEPCDVRFQWGLTGAYGNDTAWQSGKHTGDAFGQVISGLEPDMTYYFRTQARNSAGSASGADMIFRTLKESIEVPLALLDPSLKLLLEEQQV